MTAASPFALLVSAASDNQVAVDRLVRVALLVANAVLDEAVAEWCRVELAGYGASELPEYRIAAAQARATDQLGRTVPVAVEDNDDLAALFRQCRLNLPLGEIATCASADPGATFKVLFPPDLTAQLVRASPGSTDIYQLVQRASFVNAVGAVRQHVFDWAASRLRDDVSLPPGLSLESLLGLRLEDPPRVAAPPIAAHGKIDFGRATMNGPIQIVLNSPGSTTSQAISTGVDLEILRSVVTEVSQVLQSLRAEGLKDDELRTVAAPLEDLRALSKMDDPRPGWVRESLRSLRSAIEGATGSLLAELSKPHVIGLIEQLWKSVG